MQPLKKIKEIILRILYKLLPGIMVYEDEADRGSPKHINFVVQMIDHAKKYFYVLSGECNHILWEDQEIIEALRRAIKRGVKIWIVGGPEYDIESKSLAALFLNGQIAFSRLYNREDAHHFQVNDTCDVAYHAGNERDIINRLYSNSPFIRNRFIDHFFYRVNGLVPIKGEDFLESTAKVLTSFNNSNLTEADILDFKNKVPEIAERMAA